MGNKEMVEEPNRYFSSVFIVGDNIIMPELQEGQGAEEKLLGKLKGLKVDKSPGPDGLHPRVLKEIAEELVEALLGNFQESLESGRVQRTGKWL
eukprot:g28467.t1